MSAILTVRLTKEEQGILTKRSNRAGMKKATFVRKLIRDDEIVTGADLAARADRHAGDERLRIKRRKWAGFSSIPRSSSTSSMRSRRIKEGRRGRGWSETRVTPHRLEARCILCSQADQD